MACALAGDGPMRPTQKFTKAGAPSASSCSPPRIVADVMAARMTGPQLPSGAELAPAGASLPPGGAGAAADAVAAAAGGSWPCWASAPAQAPRAQAVLGEQAPGPRAASWKLGQLGLEHAAPGARPVWAPRCQRTGVSIGGRRGARDAASSHTSCAAPAASAAVLRGGLTASGARSGLDAAASPEANSARPDVPSVARPDGSLAVERRSGEAATARCCAHAALSAPQRSAAPASDACSRAGAAMSSVASESSSDARPPQRAPRPLDRLACSGACEAGAAPAVRRASALLDALRRTSRSVRQRRRRRWSGEVAGHGGGGCRAPAAEDL